MKRVSNVAVAAGLFCCLAASPAFADLATPEAGAVEAPSDEGLAALEALTVMMDDASTVSEISALSSATTSTGPSSAPTTSLGVDSSQGPVSTGTISEDGFGTGRVITGTTVTAYGEEVFQAAAPSGQQQGEVSRPVGSNEVVIPTDLSSLVTASSFAPAKITVDSDEGNPEVPVVPIPSTVLLMGAGLLGMYPLRQKL